MGHGISDFEFVFLIALISSLLAYSYFCVGVELYVDLIIGYCMVKTVEPGTWCRGEMAIPECKKCDRWNLLSIGCPCACELIHHIII